VLLTSDVLIKGRTSNTSKEANKAKTPSNLFGIDLRIAYANKKYHSGTICSGVTIGLPGI
jgi:hypothetical protein